MVRLTGSTRQLDKGMCPRPAAAAAAAADEEEDELPVASPPSSDMMLDRAAVMVEYP